MCLSLGERFVKQYEELPKHIQKKVDKAISLLETNFRHPGLRSHPVEGTNDIFEAYVDLKYRLTYQRRGDTIVPRNVDDHDECLRNP